MRSLLIWGLLSFLSFHALANPEITATLERVTNYNFRFEYHVDTFDMNAFDREKALKEIVCSRKWDCIDSRALLQTHAEVLDGFEKITSIALLKIDERQTMLTNFDELYFPRHTRLHTLFEDYKTVKSLLGPEENIAVFAEIDRSLIDPIFDPCCDSRFYFHLFRKDGTYLRLTFDWAD
jgi:hypothetical protein